MDSIARAARTYWRLNQQVWDGFKRGLAADPWVCAAVAALAVVVALLVTGHSGGALIVGVGSLLLLPLREVLDR